ARLPSGKVICTSRPAFWVTWATQTMRPSSLTTTPLPPLPTPTVAGRIFSSVFWIFASRARSSESDFGMGGGAGAFGGGAAPSPDDARTTMTSGRHSVRTDRLMGKGLRIVEGASRASGAALGRAWHCIRRARRWRKKLYVARPVGDTVGKPGGPYHV